VSNPFGSGVAVVQDHALEAEADRMGKMAAMHKASPETPASSGGHPPRAQAGAGVIHQKPAMLPHFAVRPARKNGSGWEIDATAGGGNSPAGRVRLTPSENGVYISDLSVAPDYRRHGLAKQLVQAAMRTARSQGYSVAQLEARADAGSEVAGHSLVSMYQRLGFRTTGRTRRGSPLMERRT